MSAAILTRLCHQIARKGPLWVQGQGGNLSVKSGNTLLIKASGVRLDQIRPTRGLVPLNRTFVEKQLSKIRGEGQKAEEQYATVLKSSTSHSSRPSMEAGIHLALAKKFVIHFHSLPALLMSHEYSKNRAKINAWLKNNWSETFCFVKPFRPGLLLSRWIQKNRNASVFLLQNHGVVLQSNSIQTLARWENLEKLFCRDWGYTEVYKRVTNHPTPLRLYFPDSAVFLDRLKKVLRSSGVRSGEQTFQLKANAQRLDRDACEIWKAHEALYRVCPALKPLPSSIAKKVAHLPTELYRRKNTGA